VLSPYRYRFTKDGVMENEICPVLVGNIEAADLHINSDEVESALWISWDGFLKEIEKDAEKYSPWCREEALLLGSLPAFGSFREELTY
jgi:isopentenyl-diphosphate Delta-isomerase